MFAGFVFASTTNGTVSGYAWSSNYGWLNFGCDNCGVTINDTSLSGYVWNDNIGRINLSPANGGVLNTSRGALSGYAWSENVGWINFSGVSITDAGNFIGQASGDNIGTINFGCDYCNVQTDWRPSTVRGGGPDGVGTPPFQEYPEESSGEEEPSTEEEPETSDVAPEGEMSDVNATEGEVGPLDTSGEPSIVEKITDKIIDLIPKFLWPKKEKTPEQVVTVPKLAPVSFNGFWEYLDPKPIKRFVLSPLPRDVAVLAEKFPQIEKTFSEVGVTKITDLQKLKNSKLSLPGLTKALGFAIPAFPVTQLTAEAKNRIPSEIVFVKAGGGLIDYNIALSLNNQGQTLQKITALTGQTLQFVVRVDQPVKKITGYIVFKSRKPSQVSSNVRLNNLSISTMFSNPEFAMPAALSDVIPVNGAVSDTARTVSAQGGSALGGETRLVLAKFDYEDTGNGVYLATVQAPVAAGEYEVITVIEYEDSNFPAKEIRLITVVDPEGYVFKKDGDLESRIPGAVVYLYWLNPKTKQYELWPAQDYQQENPQVTDPSGAYSFLVPNGYYYLKVDTPGYLSYDGKPFQVTEGSGVHINIELKTRYWWLGMINWQTVLLLAMTGLLLYNFYKDRKREKN